jgi:protein O-mannosyl-transferase
MLQNLSPSKQKLVVCLLLFLATLAVYWQVRNHDFINLDDEQYVTQNPYVRGGLTAANLAWAFTTTHASNWHPLTWISHQVDVQFFGMNPAGHHLVNLLLHIANTLLLFFVFNRMTQKLWQSAAVAALFALHPLHVESVAWVAERKDVLSTFFMLLTLWAYFTYTRRPGRLRYLLVAVLFALGLMSKPMLVSLPFVLLLLDYWPLGRYAGLETKPPPPIEEFMGKRKPKKKNAEEALPVFPEGRRAPGPANIFGALVTEKIPLFALTVASSIITFFAQQKGGAMSPLDDIPMLKRLGNALVSYAAYLVETLFPKGLAVFHPYPAEIAAWQLLGSAVLILCATVLVVRYRKSCPYAFVGWFWYLGMLVPVIGVVQVGMQAMADRYTYIPLVGIFILLTWGAADLAERIGLRKSALTAVAGLVLAAIVAATWVQVSYWQTSVILFEHALAVTAGNYLAHANLGVALNRMGRGQEAASHYLEAIRINPNYSSPHFNLANYYAARGDKEQAYRHYQEAVRIRPDYANAYNNLGVLLASQGRFEEAASQYEKALRIEPANAGFHYNCGIALANRGRLSEAAAQFRDALALRPNYAEAHNDLGKVLMTEGRPEEAASHFREAVWLKPNFTEARRNLDTVLVSQKKQGKK